uniref:Ammonium transporter AmtB-like domain-containing protein n=1 Tax=Varanus komodoensis TaxID=61221 RepID=A0A8D2J1R1_VARKO
MQVLLSAPAPSGPASNLLHATFSLFRDVQLMLLAGLGLLLAFMKGYGLSAVAFNFLLISVCTQWTLVVQGFTYHCHDGRIHLGLHNILTAEFAAVTVLISAGAILGRTSPVQLLPMGLCEIPLDMAVDVGGTLTLHVFACYFGLGTTIALHWPALQLGHPKETPPYSSDLLSLVGTTFLWAFWPGFVAVLIQPGHAQHRVASCWGGPGKECLAAGSVPSRRSCCLCPGVPCGKHPPWLDFKTALFSS